MKKILIANRGEIALRVMRSAKEMGIKTVAIYSEADRSSPHVRYADEAVCVGPPPSSESYLNVEKIIETCKNLEVDAIHPGYGFLSENADFARRLVKENITLIGPSAEAMEMMGDKLKAKATVKAFEVPMVPGTDEKITDVEEAKSIAESIGYPILIKAAAGGGGKGMRVVEQAKYYPSPTDLEIDFWSDSDDDEYILPKSKVTRIDHCQNCQSKSYHLFNEVKGELTQKLSFPKRPPIRNSRPPPLPKKTPPPKKSSSGGGSVGGMQFAISLQAIQSAKSKLKKTNSALI